MWLGCLGYALRTSITPVKAYRKSGEFSQLLQPLVMSSLLSTIPCTCALHHELLPAHDFQFH